MDEQSRRWLWPLEVLTLRLYWSVLSSLELPAYPGSTFRGLFGRLFRFTMCHSQLSDCESCSSTDMCVYRHIFETTVPAESSVMSNGSRVSNPFTFIPPKTGDRTQERGEKLVLDKLDWDENTRRPIGEMLPDRTSNVKNRHPTSHFRTCLTCSRRSDSCLKRNLSIGLHSSFWFIRYFSSCAGSFAS